MSSHDETRGAGLLNAEVVELADKVRTYIAMGNSASKLMIGSGVHINTVYNIVHGHTCKMTRHVAEKLRAFFDNETNRTR